LRSIANEPKKADHGKPVDLGAETLFVLAALILMLRYKALSELEQPGCLVALVATNYWFVG